MRRSLFFTPLLLALACTVEGGSTSSDPSDASPDAGGSGPDACVGADCDDPCAGIQCTAPGPCEASPGQCRAGTCVYTVAHGIPCDDGDPCTDGDSCELGTCVGAPRVCDAPPDAVCADEDTLTVWAGPGACTPDGCGYPSTGVPCATGCQDGACAGDPCQGVVCDAPPDACHGAAGVCSGGACVYPPLTGTACDDQDPCSGGDRCAEGVCVGEIIACTVPPPAECLDPQTLRVWASPGVCGDAGCTYATADVPCPAGCHDGACVAELCAGVVCDTPPGPCWAATGTCQSGQCHYAPKDGASCSDDDPCTTGDVCDAGACLGQPLSCTTPPAPGCLDDTTLRVWSKNGTCGAGGVCQYTLESVACPGGCQNAACVGDPCVGVTCDDPPGPCYAASGVCADGLCSYAPLTGVACADGKACTDGDTCQAGTCYGAPTVCDAPPPAACVDAQTLRTWSPVGACGATGCTYTPADKPCANGCADGACQSNVCAGVICDQPPSPCHAAVGICSNGVCSYAYADGAPCDDGSVCTEDDACESGACHGAPVVCDAPPAAACSGATLTSWSPVGTCDPDEGCAYTPTTSTCALGCAGNACSGDPCAGVVCTAPPAPECVGGGLQTASPTGSCANGVCSYATTVTPCAWGCSAGACASAPKVLINEVLYDAVGADSDVFVELVGPPGTSLVGFTLVGVNGGDGADYQPVALTGTIPADGFYVVANPQAAPWVLSQADQTSAAVDYQNGPDSVVLRQGDKVQDAVGYGSFVGATFAGEGTAAVDPAAGQSIGRDALSTDTGDNADDFSASTTPTPGHVNTFGCAPGERFCDGACVDPLTSETWCGASSCTATPCAGGETCVAGVCQVVCAPVCGNGQVCVAGTCQTSCTNACTPGATSCSGSQVATCVTGSNGCAVWSAAVACPAGQVCQGSACTSACTDACTAGAKRCDAGLVQTCAPSAAGCLAWSAGVACGSGQTCTGDGLCGFVISTSRELCGDIVVPGSVTIQGGAKVTCATGQLSLTAKEILIDPASSIDLSGASTETSGQSWRYCTPNCNGTGMQTGTSGGGNGTAGEKGVSTSVGYKRMGDYCGGGGWSCQACAGPPGGGVRGTSYSLDAPLGGKGGDGCHTSLINAQCGTSALAVGGASIRLTADTVKVFGAIKADGVAGEGKASAAESYTVGAAGGAGGTIVLAASKLTVTGLLSVQGGAGQPATKSEYYCGTQSTAGGAGGQGRIKLAHGKDPVLTGNFVGAVATTSWMPPVAFSSGMPLGDLPIHPTFGTLTVTWAPPYPEVAGYYHLLSSGAAAQVTAVSGAFTTTPSVQITSAQVASATKWTLNVVSVHEGGQISALQSGTTLSFIGGTGQLASTSHPSGAAWVPYSGQPAITASWTPPSASVPAAAYKGYWVRLDRSTDTPLPPPDGAGWTWTTAAQALFTTATSGQALSAGAWHLHVVGVDQLGNPAPAVATRTFLLGVEPAKSTFFGYVTSASGQPVAGGQVSLQPLGYGTTTDSNGYFLVSGVYAGSYDLTVTQGVAAKTVSLSVDASVSPYTVTLPSIP